MDFLVCLFSKYTNYMTESKKFVDNEIHYQVGQNGELRWDGKRDNGTLSRIGIYVMKISFQDMASTKSWESAKTIILAKPL